jgi:hypothetical protein
MPYQDEMLEGQVVSIWAGDLDTADDVTEYFGQPFESAFGFLLDQDDLPEIANSPMRGPTFSPRNPPLERVDVRELIEAFSWSCDWANDAERACREQGIDAVKLMVAFPHLKYRSELCRNLNAPLRFIGNFPWPNGHDDWQERLKAQIICPPFPILRRHAFAEGELFAWKGRVHLEAWKGFAAREELADEFMTFRFSAEPDGDLGLNVSPLDNRQSSFQPTHPQARAFQNLLDNQGVLRETVLNAIFSAYGAWRESYLAQDMPSESMPKLSNATDLVHIIAPSTVYVLANEKDGFTHIGFGFSCKWDEEHALGVLTHKGRVVDIGQADTAFTDKYDSAS